MKRPPRIEPATGKLGVLLVGLGAVATTFVAGCLLARRGLGRPIGSLTQLGTIRLGRRAEARSPRISELLPLASIDDLLFGAWDVRPANALESALEAGVLDRRHLDPIADDLAALRPMPGVFRGDYVRRITATHTKRARDKAELVEDDPDSFRTKERSKLGVLEHILRPDAHAELYGSLFHKVRIEYYPPRGDAKEGWDNVDIFGWLGYPMQIKVDLLCRDSILAAPVVLDLALFADLAQRAGLAGPQDWLGFYFKSPMTSHGLAPEHDLFIQAMKLKNTLRWMVGEELVTHFGDEGWD